MSKIAKDFGSYVNDKAFDRYTELKQEKFGEEDIVDMFIEFTKKQQKETLKLEQYVDTWIDDWCKLFPKGIRQGSKFVRSDPKVCLKKMVNFIKTYKYDKDIIFFATREYIKDCSYNDYAFIRCATYFIDKLTVGSGLAEWCQKVEDIDEEEIKQTINTNEFI